MIKDNVRHRRSKALRPTNTHRKKLVMCLDGVPDMRMGVQWLDTVASVMRSMLHVHNAVRVGPRRKNALYELRVREQRKFVPEHLHYDHSWANMFPDMSRIYLMSAITRDVLRLCRDPYVSMVLGVDFMFHMGVSHHNLMVTYWFPYWTQHTWRCANVACDNSLFTRRWECGVCGVVFCCAACHARHVPEECGLGVRVLRANDRAMGPDKARRHNRLFPPPVFAGFPMQSIQVLS